MGTCGKSSGTRCSLMMAESLCLEVFHSAIAPFIMRRLMRDEASYVCDSCGEEIVVPIDLAAGADQEYVEDCPVCCCPNFIRVEIDEHGGVRVWAERE